MRPPAPSAIIERKIYLLNIIGETTLSRDHLLDLLSAGERQGAVDARARVVHQRVDGPKVFTELLDQRRHAV